MLALQTVDLSKNIDLFVHRAIQGENLLVTTDKNETAVLISPKEYADYQKLRHNAEYLSMLDRGYEDIKNGRGIKKSMEELESMADE